MRKTFLLPSNSDTSQKKEMIASFSRMAKAEVVFLILSWGSRLFYEKDIPIWWTGYFWTIISVGMIGISFACIRYITRAYQFHVLYFLIFLPISFLLLDASIRLALFWLGESGWIYVLVCLLALIGIFVYQVCYYRIQLKTAEKHNIKSGRLNKNTCEWDLTARLVLSNPDMEDSRRRRWNIIARFTPLAPPIGFAISEYLSGRSEGLIASILIFTILWISSLAFAREIAIVAQLAEWEREIGKEIVLRINKT